MENKNQNKNNEDGNPMFGLLGTASSMGMHMISGPVVGCTLGYLCDKYIFDSWPVGAGIGVLLGILAGFRNIYYDSQYLKKQQEKLHETRKKL